MVQMKSQHSLALTAALNYVKNNAPQLVYSEISKALAEQPAQQESVVDAVHDCVRDAAATFSAIRGESQHCDECHAFERATDWWNNWQGGEPYYTTRQPLTDEQIDSIVAMSCKKDSSHLDAARVARAIEAAHNIKE